MAREIIICRQNSSPIFPLPFVFLKVRYEKHDTYKKLNYRLREVLDPERYNDVFAMIPFNFYVD